MKMNMEVVQNNFSQNKNNYMINLEKKSSISLAKQAPGLTNVKVGLSWIQPQMEKVQMLMRLFFY